jgi:hypothetical protein
MTILQQTLLKRRIGEGIKNIIQNAEERIKREKREN